MLVGPQKRQVVDCPDGVPVKLDMFEIGDNGQAVSVATHQITPLRWDWMLCQLGCDPVPRPGSRVVAILSEDEWHVVRSEVA